MEGHGVERGEHHGHHHHHDHHPEPEPLERKPVIHGEHRGAHDHAAMMSDPAMAKRMERDMARRFWVALALTIPIVVITGHVPGMPMLVHPPLSNWLALALTTPAHEV